MEKYWGEFTSHVCQFDHAQKSHMFAIIFTVFGHRLPQPDKFTKRYTKRYTKVIVEIYGGNYFNL